MVKAVKTGLLTFGAIGAAMTALVAPAYSEVPVRPWKTAEVPVRPWKTAEVPVRPWKTAEVPVRPWKTAEVPVRPWIVNI